MRHKNFVMASGEMSPSEFTSFLTTVCESLVDHTRDGSIHFVCMDWGLTAPSYWRMGEDYGDRFF